MNCWAYDPGAERLGNENVVDWLTRRITTGRPEQAYRLPS
jgi:hypothetical protein